MADANAYDKSDNEQRKLLLVFKPLLKVRLIPSTILLNLPGIISMDDAAEICRIERVHGRSSAVDELLDRLFTKSSENPGWFGTFINGLHNSGNEFLADYIQGTTLEDIYDLDLFTKLIEICASSLEDINPREILVFLPCLDDRDREVIEAHQRSDGPKSAVLTLLDRLIKKGGGWFKEFVVALKEVGRNDLAQLLSGNREQHDENNVCNRDVVDNLESSNLNNNVENCRQNDLENQIGDEVVVEGNVTESNSPTECEGENPLPAGNIRGNSSESNQTEKGTVEASRQLEHDNATQPASNVILRKYQEDLVKCAEEGKNTIICAPTGSGKTFTAVHIIKEHLQKGRCQPGQPRRIVVFLVNQRPLVKQQEGVFKTFLEPHRYKVIQLTGEAQHISLSDVIDQGYDLIVLTAQILENALDRKIIKCLSVFSLLIFDECHHTQKKQPFNVIMSRYRDLKKSKTLVRKPQIIGLTASLGVGKALSVTNAVEHVFKLCANLDVEELSTIRNKNDLEMYVPVPHEDFINVPGRMIDAFAIKINHIMSEIEDIIPPMKGMNSLRGVKPKPERGTQDYERWVTHLRKFSTSDINDAEIRRLFKTCTDQLKEYNNCLFINKEARSKDALYYLDRYFEKLEELREGFDELDNHLFDKFKGQRPEIEAIAKDPTNKNPVLEKLGSLILKAYLENSESRGMILTKTKASCYALKSWIDETDELTELNPAVMVGSSDSGDIPGMTQEQQARVLEKFEEGYHKIIVCTSVGQEGIDIKQCNLVLRYNFSTNEIGRIQAKGRSRAKDGHTYLVTRSDTKVKRQEEINVFREHLMYEAIREITKMSNDEFVAKVQHIQKNDIDRCASPAAFETKEIPTIPVTFRCGRCKKTACLSSDFRVLNNSHHIVVNERFCKEEITIKEERNKRKIDDLFFKEGRVRCIKCMYDWGSMARVPLLKDGVFPILRVRSFELEIPGHGRKQYQKWREIPFGIEPVKIPGKSSKGETGARDREEE
ncbi:ATP-dependent RNA helicase DHX58-like [Glandiceps talaboti]